MNPEHLLEQAEALLEAPEHGAPRQADKRRAISAAYYALFHFVLSAAAGEFIGGIHRASPPYRFVYRSIAHGRVKAICKEAPKATPSASFQAFWPAGGFGQPLIRFATLFVELIEARHTADYDPVFRVKTEEAKRFVRSARRAIASFEAVDPAERKLFLTFLVCDPKSGG